MGFILNGLKGLGTSTLKRVLPGIIHADQT